MNTTKSADVKIHSREKVGVLLVHGIGEQCQFEHLEGEARNIAMALRKSAAQTNEKRARSALRELDIKTNGKTLQQAVQAAVNQVTEKHIIEDLKELVNKISTLTKYEWVELAAKKLASNAQVVQVSINSLPSAAYGAKQATWQEGERSPVVVEVYDYNYKDESMTRLTQIYFHQVWWADLDEPQSLWSELRFWGWGLSLWTLERKSQLYLPGSVERMKLPDNGKFDGQDTIGFWGRLRLFWVSLVILLILPVLSLLNFVLRGLLSFNIPRPDILAQFVGDVKLFQQDKRIGKGPLEDLSLPPRVTLRRRMIRGLVEMALRRYHRWYVLAHSQGTVLAFNGLMETAQSLPNYLTEELWQKAKDQELIRPAAGDECLRANEKQVMQPPFPAWRNKEFILDRRELFKNLKGVLTYGSPLSKFAALWPVIVPLNDETAFSQEFQWLNVYDPTDPVAGGTKPFASAGSKDFAYKAEKFHLLSHIQYLTFNKGDRIRLVDVIANWLVAGKLTISSEHSSVNQIDAAETNLTALNQSQTRLYGMARWAMWIFAGLLIGGLLGVLVSNAISRFVPQLAFYPDAVGGLIHTIKVALPNWLSWSLATIYLLGTFSTLGALISGTRSLYVGLGLGTLITIILSALPFEVQQPALNFILTAFLEGVLYIILAAIIVFIVGLLGIPARSTLSSLEKR